MCKPSITLMNFHSEEIINKESVSIPRPYTNDPQRIALWGVRITGFPENRLCFELTLDSTLLTMLSVPAGDHPCLQLWWGGNDSGGGRDRKALLSFLLMTLTGPHTL